MLFARTRSLALIGGLAVSIAVLAAPPAPAHAAPVGTTAHELSTRSAAERDGRVVLADAQGCNSSGVYCTMSNVGGGKCWSDNQVSGNGVPVTLNNCNDDSSGQLWAWTLTYNKCSSGCLRWNVAYDGRCLNDPYGTGASGTQLQMWDCYTTTYEELEYENVGPNNSQYIFWVDGTDACLSDDGNSGSGVHLVLETCNGGSNQRWVWG